MLLFVEREEVEMSTNKVTCIYEFCFGQRVSLVVSRMKHYLPIFPSEARRRRVDYLRLVEPMVDTSSSRFDFLQGAELVNVRRIEGGSCRIELRFKSPQIPDDRDFVEAVRDCIALNTDMVGNVWTHTILGVRFLDRNDNHVVNFFLGIRRPWLGRWDDSSNRDEVITPEKGSWLVVSKGAVTVSTGSLLSSSPQSRFS